MSKALILIDIQNDYFSGGKNPLYNPEAALGNASYALKVFRREGLPIFHIRHISTGPGATFFLPGEFGSETHESVAALPGEEVIEKHAPDSFFMTALDDMLSGQNINELFICGMMSHMCVDTTVRSGKMRGYFIYLIADACTTKDLEWGGETIPAMTVHKAFMASLDGIFAKVINIGAVESLIAE